MASIATTVHIDFFFEAEGHEYLRMDAPGHYEKGQSTGHLV